MTRIGSLIGEVVVGVSGSSPSISEPVQITTPTITAEQSGRLTLTASTTATLSIFGGISHAILVQLAFYDASTGLKKDVTITQINGVACAHMPSFHDFVYSSEDTAAGLTGIQVVPGAGNNTICRYVLAGV